MLKSTVYSVVFAIVMMPAASLAMPAVKNSLGSVRMPVFAVDTKFVWAGTRSKICPKCVVNLPEK